MLREARAAQPPGGRSNFSFDDGSNASRGYGAAAPTQQPPRQRPSRQVAQPPGGCGSFALDDGSGGQSWETPTDMAAQTGAPIHRHTNGLRRMSNNQHAAEPSYAVQPPGGRSNFSLGDGSDIVVVRNPTEHDALSDFVAAQRNPETTHAAVPPGGKSSFSLGWGSDNSANQHHAYQRKHPDPRFRSMQGHANPQDAACDPPLAHAYPSAVPPLRKDMYASNTNSRSKFSYEPMLHPELKPNQNEGNGFAHGVRPRCSSNSYASGATMNSCNTLTDRSSTRVVAPPGGHSNFSFG